MPTGYAGEGKYFSKKLGRWLTKEKEKAFDYTEVDTDSMAFLISFFRFYPDYFADMFRSEKAEYGLELPQRLMMRILVRYRNTFITGVRGLTKTYIMLLTKMIEGVLYPGEIIKYTAPSQKQAANLARQAFHQIEKDYPALSAMWHLKNERDDMFRIETVYGSEFTMYSPRGSNCSQTIAEEIGQEGEDGFDMEKYEKDILPTCRLVRKVNQKPDRTHPQLKHAHITNASSKQNRAYTEHRNSALKDMLYGEKYEGFVIDMSWITALICQIRDINYIKDQKSKLTPLDWQREMCARYTGTSENPLISDEVLAKSKKLLCMESHHCGDLNAIYIVSHDVSYAEGKKNAKCSDVVLKLTEFSGISKRDKYRKQTVYIDAYDPPKTAYLQAQKLKSLWMRYCLTGGETTYLVIDAQAYGSEIVEELMKPTADGTPPLCCVGHVRYAEIEQDGALPVIYPLKAGTRGATDEDASMIRYAQVEFEQGNVELLTGSILDGMEAYKRKHGIKTEKSNAAIISPYKKSEELCVQIANLKTKVSGLTLKEERKSKSIQRDIWSALKYGLRMAQLLESKKVKKKYQKKSSWSDAIAKGSAYMPRTVSAMGGTRNRLLENRKR